MSDDWKVGDLAVCVDARDNPFSGCPCPLTEGGTYRVTGLAPPGKCPLYRRTVDLPGLFLAGVNNGNPNGFAPDRFRKICPDNEPCEEEFVTLLNLSKPVNIPEPEDTPND